MYIPHLHNILFILSIVWRPKFSYNLANPLLGIYSQNIQLPLQKNNAHHYLLQQLVQQLREGIIIIFEINTGLVKPTKQMNRQSRQNIETQICIHKDEIWVSCHKCLAVHNSRMLPIVSESLTPLRHYAADTTISDISFNVQGKSRGLKESKINEAKLN